jgi:hypothetical protein
VRTAHGSQGPFFQKIGRERERKTNQNKEEEKENAEECLLIV